MPHRESRRIPDRLEHQTLEGFKLHSTTMGSAVSPMLRWAGGKRWLLPQIQKLFPGLGFNNYHEPFLGGAAFFFGTPMPGRAFLSDLNSELIETYRTVRDHPVSVHSALGRHLNDEKYYYTIRSWDAQDPIELAARFIYLNHTSFNGIYRVNLKGHYNVPFGRRKSPNFPSLDALSIVSGKLKNSHLSSGDFAGGISNVGQGDLVFLDPPYTVAHNNNGFIKYNRDLFSFEDQRRLSKFIDQVKEREAFYILTNAAHSSIAELFEKGDRRLDVFRGNSVGGRSASRGTANEFLFTNVGVS